MMRKNDIRRELTSQPQATMQPHAPATLRGVWRGAALRVVAAMLLAVVLLVLFYQIPVTHVVNIGGYDAAYVQGFYDPEPLASPTLAGSDGSARWSRAVAYLVFPQAGLPAQVTLRLRAPQGKTANVRVLLNGATELDNFTATDVFREYPLTIMGGLLKPNDVVIELRSTVTPLNDGDARTVGVLLDRATYRVGRAPVTPYPAQLAYGALVAGMLALLLNDERRKTNDESRNSPFVLRPSSFVLRPSSFVLRPSSFVLRLSVALLLISCAWFLLYRAQPLYPYPVRWLLPALVLALAAVLTLRHGSTLVARVPALLDALALGGVALWLVAVLRAAQSHVALSLPGVENDFRVFALRSAKLWGVYQPSGSYNATTDGVLRADGFYHLGYPFLVWLIRPLTQDNPFLAARVIAALSGAVMIGAAWWLARMWLGRGAALLTVLILVLGPLTTQYALYVGTDMPFAALCTLALALLIRGQGSGIPGQRSEPSRHPVIVLPRHLVILSGVAAGAAFLVRHPGVLLLPLGWITLWSSQQSVISGRRSALDTRTTLLVFTLAFLVTISPQLVVNTVQTGNPLFSQQAENVWLGVFAGSDWSRSDEVPDGISFAQVVLADPLRFLANWWNNVRAFVGTGAEDATEFGRAVQLRLLGFPANWLAVVGVIGWLVVLLQGEGVRRSGKENQSPLLPRSPFPFLVWIALNVVTLSIGLALQPRFVLPLLPVYALAAAWTLAGDRGQGTGVKPLSFVLHLSSFVLVALLWGNFAVGASRVLNNQAQDEVAAVRLVQERLQAGERLIVCGKDTNDWCGYTALRYSAIAHRTVSVPPNNDRAALRATGARYVLTANTPPPGLTAVSTDGTYKLFRLN